ncbi:PREDICTED: protein KRI1 homolog [Branchiostoma belcheri]|uniref:Protein KRI1 homolog n=1 Tax=Branchiostoma belcheri TaxID=7741 RepID=A0A6P4Z493_BRABE|nr:PREDICTED: protein KRI1 homolog [Branchiostoma belcheri]
MAEDDVGFRINKDFAKKYDEYRRKEELQKLKDRYGDVDVDASSSSSSETEDEDAVELTPAIEKGFLKTLAALKSKDPRIYQQDTNFYDEDKKGEPSKTEEKGKKPKEKPMFLKDYERKVLLEKGGVPSDDESSEEEFAMNRPTSPSYYEEQEQIKQSFKQALSAGDDDDDEDGSLLVERRRTQQELEEDERDYTAWLTGQKEELANKYKDMGPLKQYWTNPELDKGEAFLRDYILNQEYRDPDKDRIPTYDEIVDDDDDIDYSEDEEYLEKAENFERKFNFRYEEPDAEFIKSYPRTIASSVRRKDERRKKKREETRERKKDEKHKKKEELRQLKNLKKKEILDKLDHLKEITGNQDIGFNQADLEGDFDPKKYDEMMQNVFNEDYYGEEEGQKPEFPEEEELEEDVNWNQWQGPDGAEGGGGEYDWENSQEWEEPHCDDPDFNMDADYDPEAQQSTSQEILAMSKKKKRRRKLGTYFAEAVNKKKPVFDPNDKTFEEYLSEYYKLDYEDVIGDMPCRFKYRNVMANDFGLTTEEVLTAADSELNTWCSVKAMSKYRSEEEEHRELKRYRKKGRDTRKKHRILASLSREIEDNEEEDKDAATPTMSQEVSKKRKDRPELSQDTGEVTKKQKTDSQTEPETTAPTEGVKETKVVEREEDKSMNGGGEDGNATTPKKKKRRRQRKRKLTHETPATDNNPTQQQEDTTETNGKGETRKQSSNEGNTAEDVNKKDNNKKEKKKQKAVARVQGEKKQPPKMSAERIKAYGFNPKKFKYILQNQKKKQKKESNT